MKKTLLPMSVCLFFLGVVLYSYMDAQNRLTELKITAFRIEKEMKQAEEEKCRLAYEVDQFYHPNHLIELARLPEYGHLKHPVLKEILSVPQEAYAYAKDVP